jgi:muramidase (phage lysozyme)
MAFRDILKQNRQQGSGLISSLATAAVASGREKLDIRNSLFKSGSLMNAIFPNVKGYQYKDKTDKLKTSPEMNLSSEKLDVIAQSTSIAAKNSIVLPSMARDMFMVKQNIIKLVKHQVGKAAEKDGSWFTRQAARENQYESQFAKKSTTPTPVGGKPEKSGMGLLTTLALVSGALMLFGGEIGKTVGMIGGVITALLGLKMVIGAILGMKALASIVGGVPTKGAPAGKGVAPKSRMPGLIGLGATALGIGYLNNFAGSSSESNADGTSTGPKTMTTMDKTVTAGLGAMGAYSTYQAVKGGKEALSASKTAVLDAKTMSVSQLSKSQPQTRWGKFLAFVAKKSPNLWGKVGLKLAQAGALAAIPIVGWIGAAVNLGLGLWTAWELFELWKEFSGQEDASDKSPSKVSGATSDVPTESSSATPSSPTPVPSGPVKAENMLDVIGAAEGGKMGYDAINRGKAGDTPSGMPGLSNMTVGDVMKLQKDKKVFAAGKYQIIPTTLEGLIKDGVAKKEDIFNAETQDKLAKELINRRLTKAGNDPMKQQLELSKEFASIANPYTGSSYYDGKGNNKASIASIFPGTPGSAIAASSTAVADGRMASSSQPVVINSPQTVNNVSNGGGGGGLAAASSVFDTEFGKLLIERSVG